MDYQTKATQIIKNAIKSAIFIDEKAREVYTEKSEDESLEEILSVNLHKNFKKEGISLAVHKFKKGDELNEDTLNYLFENRDLVLLDWKLDGNEGEEFALKMLANIVNRPHIHFCAIYTSTSDREIDNAILNVLSYFSSKSKSQYEEISETLISFEEKILNWELPIKNLSLFRFDKEKKKEIVRNLMNNEGNRSSIIQLKSSLGVDDPGLALIYAGFAFGDHFKSETINPSPSFISSETKTIVIENTIITILKKDNDYNPNNLIHRLSNQISKSEESFTQLLGLEVQNIFSTKSSFVDSNLLKASKEAFIYHRNKLREGGLNDYFQEFVKDSMLEKLSLDLRSEPLSLLEDSFLDSFGEVTPKDEELIAMNVFYNSTKLKTDNRVNFGDVFEVKKTDGSIEYFICITALCDCLRPKKINNNFFFAKGIKIRDKSKALKLGDTAFLSYISISEIVVWTDVSSSSEDQYKPKYIKPFTINISNVKFDENDEVEFKELDSLGEINEFKATYRTTIKSNYTQRIANHAFGHPLRVGVDFVTK